MNRSTCLKSLAAVFVFASLCMIGVGGCKKRNLDPVPPAGPGGTTNMIVDTVSGRLQFFDGSKKQGPIPNGPAASSLKISFKDTFYLFDEIKRPMKFLHMDITKNVSGVFLQVQATSNGSAASHYYDIPEVPDVADSDTVSVIMIGIDPRGLPLPQTYDVRIVPYDENKQPIASAVRPLKIDHPKKQTPSNAGSCGLGGAATDIWAWDLSLTDGPGVLFYNDPFTIHSAAGQDIEGSCCRGNTTWPEFCVGEQKHNRRLHFSTYYQIKQETFSFLNGGQFVRVTEEDSPVPLPDESDFCGSGAGKVRASLKTTRYDGDWTIRPINRPSLYKGDSLELILITKSSTGTGYGNPGGVIHQLDCELGSLVLVQSIGEGSGKYLIKFYSRKKIIDLLWYSFS